MTNTNLTDEQKQAVDDIVTRRMENTGESEEKARLHVANYLRGLAIFLYKEQNGLL